MTHIISQIAVALPGDLEGLTRENFVKYASWGSSGRDVTKRIVTPFTGALKEASGFSDDSMPDEPTTTSVDVGDKIRYEVTTKPTTKNPAYKEVHTALGAYLANLEDQHERKKHRVDVITREGVAYVAVDDILEKVAEDIADTLSGKGGVSQSVALVEPDTLVTDVPLEMVVSMSRNYAALTDGNARFYENAKAFVTKGNAQAKAFKDLLKEEALEEIGGEPTEVTALEYGFGDLTFVHQVEPKSQPTYKPIIMALVGESPKRITKRSRVGDLVMAKMLFDGGAGLLEKRGLIDEEFRADYAPLFREDNKKVYVSLPGLQKRFKTYTEGIVTRSLEQNLMMKPGPLM